MAWIAATPCLVFGRPVRPRRRSEDDDSGLWLRA